MTALLDTQPAAIPTMADALAHLHALGNVPPERVLMRPLPGTATFADLEAVHASGRKLVELVDGVLVEKAMGTRESFLATLLAHFLVAHVLERRLGVVLGGDGFVRLGDDLVRAPDVSFIPWQRWQRATQSADNYLRVYPDLMVEVLSPSNTRGEIDRKLRDFFTSGTRLAWIIDPRTQTARVHTSVDAFLTLDADGTLDGGDVLPGFALTLAELFRRTQPPQEPPT
jgi:Uma2 family endonuclease